MYHKSDMIYYRMELEQWGRHNNYITNWTTEESVFRSRQVQGIFSSTQRPCSLSGPPIVLCNAYQICFPWARTADVSRWLRTSKDTFPLSHMPSWSLQGQFYLNLSWHILVLIYEKTNIRIKFPARLLIFVSPTFACALQPKAWSLKDISLNIACCSTLSLLRPVTNVDKISGLKERGCDRKIEKNASK